MTSASRPFSCLTWNLHRCCGNDGVVDTERTLAVLQAEVWQPGADALVLTEADADGPPYPGLLDLGQLEAATGLRSVHTSPAHRWSDASHGFLGTIVLVHPDCGLDHTAVLDLPGKVHRGAVVVEMIRDGRVCRLIGAHLSLSQGLRWAQMRVIAQYIERRPEMPTILAGDLNEWRPWLGLAFSHKGFGLSFKGPAKGTFPVRRPVLPLDRVLTAGAARVLSTKILDGPGIRLVSDHRPLRAEVVLTGKG